MARAFFDEAFLVEICTYRYLILLFSLVVSIIFSVESVAVPPTHYFASFSTAAYSLCPLLIGLAFSFFMFRFRYERVIQNSASLGIAVGCLALIVIGTWAGTTHWANVLTNNLVYLFVAAMILCVGIAIVIQILRLTNNFRITDEKTWQNFLLQLILFVPCLLEDLAKYLSEQFALTSPPIVILFFVELIVIVLFFTLPFIIQYLAKQNKIWLLPGTLPLSTKVVLSDSSPFTNSVIKPSDSIDPSVLPTYLFRQNYGISMWIYINRYDSTMKEHEYQIFNYGSIPFQGKPCVYAQSGQVYVSLSNTNAQGTRIPLDFPAQKWNNLVFNYRYNQIDVFLNAELVKTVAFGSTPPTYSVDDGITVGDNHGYLSGAICNISYSLNPFQKTEIATSYNLLRFLNPPLVPGVSSSQNNTTIKANSKATPAPSLIQSVQEGIHKAFPSFVVSNSSPKQKMQLNNDTPQFAGYGASQTSFTTNSSS